MPVITPDFEPDENRGSAERLRRELEQALRRSRVAKWKSMVRMAALFVGILVFFRGVHGPWIVAVIIVAKKLKDVSAARSLRVATIDVAERGDVTAIDLLLQARAVGDKSARAAATRGLKRILPLLTEADREWLPRSALRGIHQLLTGWDADLTLAALRALEQVGDGRSLEAVRKLAHRIEKFKSWDVGWRSESFAEYVRALPGVTEEARRVANAVEARLELERQQALLLRPAQKSEQATLLRPAVSFGAEPPEQLLRPSDSGL